MSSPLQGHRRIDRRSLEMHRAIAAKLQAHPALLEIASGNLARWSASHGRSQPYWDEWQEILGRPLPEILELLEEDSEHMNAMRQATPFAGSGPGGAMGDLFAVRAATGRPAVTRAQLEHIIRAAGSIADG